MDVDTFRDEVANGSPTARDPRWKRPYTELTYLPQIELLKYLRANGFRTYIVTGGGQDFVRVYAEGVYGIPPEQVVGSAGGVSYQYDADRGRCSSRSRSSSSTTTTPASPRASTSRSGAGPISPSAIRPAIGRCCEYTKAGDGARLAMLVLHDDGEREYAYGPAQGLPDTKVGRFTQELYDEAIKDGWIVVSMKNDWKRIFAFD